MSAHSGIPKKIGLIWRALLEVGSVVFLSYAVLLMREFTKSTGQGKTLSYAIEDVFTFGTAIIAIFSGIVGCIVIEYLREKL